MQPAGIPDSLEARRGVRRRRSAMRSALLRASRPCERAGTSSRFLVKERDWAAKSDRAPAAAGALSRSTAYGPPACRENSETVHLKPSTPARRSPVTRGHLS